MPFYQETTEIRETQDLPTYFLAKRPQDWEMIDMGE
jgi:hypothetical protein